MVRQNDEQSGESWLTRARAQAGASDIIDAGASVVVVRDAGSSSGGWDPYDVWLRRVHQPRSRVRPSQRRLENT